jgi:hypothetical protein
MPNDREPRPVPATHADMPQSAGQPGYPILDKGRTVLFGDFDMGKLTVNPLSRIRRF